MRLGGAKVLGAAFLVASLFATAPARALDPERGLAQYKHSRWTLEDGAPAGIEAIAQTPEGFLWLGTPQGLIRFDGVTFQPISAPPTAHAMTDRVVSLLVTRSGALWAGYEQGGIAVFENGRSRVLYDPKIFDEVVFRMAEGLDGSIWAATTRAKARLVRFSGGAWTPMAVEGGLPDRELTDLLVARDGALWVGLNGAVARLAPGARRFSMVRTDLAQGVGLAQDRAGRIWASDARGTRLLAGPPAARSAYRHASASRITRIMIDRDQNLWGAQHPDGVFRIRAGAQRPETFSAGQGLTSAMAYEVFEDREGSIWVATVRGLDRWRATSITPEPVVPASSPYGYIVFADARGVVWITDSDTLYRARPGEPLTPVVRGLKHPSALCDAPGGGLWVGLGETMVRVDGDKVSPVSLPSSSDTWVSACAQDGAGNGWVAAFMAGLFRHDGHRWTHLQPKPLGRSVTALVADTEGRVVIDAGLGAVLWDGGTFHHIKTLPRAVRGGTMPMAAGPLGVLAGSDRGLTRFKDQATQFISRDRFSFLGLSHGLAQTAEETWLFGAAGLVRMQNRDLARAFDDPNAALPARIYDLKDGLPGPASFRYRADLAVGGDGRVWIATTNGVASLDPARQPFNRIVPPVAIQGVVIDGVRSGNLQSVVLPRGARSLQIDYTALSLAVPERVRFRYRLEGVDKDWVEAGARRSAFYTNLRPGKYVFRVKAANNDGVWNEQGASLALDLPPTLFQSRLFLAACLAAAAALAVLAYRLRLRSVSERLQAGLRERMAERERIARELHDTLLQGVQGLILKFQSSSRQVPPGSPAREQLEKALDRAEDVVVEARDRVRSLRADAASDLGATLADVAEQMSLPHAARTQVTVEGAVLDLHPVVADEIERIVVEALFNAHRHAEASHIAIDVTFDPRRLCVRVRDDGVGIEQAVLDAGGREGHFGLWGMQERARKIGGALTIRSRTDQGTEIELIIPGGLAYAKRRSAPWRKIWRRAPRSEVTA
ncbi:sensor histidine kinase [Caulobacter radicis]|uniref:sensor histidine kinase n=1 Tax=Caulobacter radicis TaxID=2172650 RepID=UPI001A9C675A|nr:sensor histidine kinase [Caulobacter radicis]